MTDGAESFQTAFNVSRETIERLEVFESLLIRWNPAINLVSKATLSQIWDRHFTDSAQIWKLRPESARSWLDLGSGAGFPGLVIAVLAAEQEPALHVALVESDARKSTFLANTAREMGIDVTIHTERAENLEPQRADIISARALAPMHKLLGYAMRHRNDRSICLFLKGANHESELTEARKYWTFDLQKTPSRTGSGGVILKIGAFGRV
ncbi:MAG: 16S rRNA (guanine(527)-N(7))-methyltransferase RsmG [Rhodobacteraceae bacterium]|nr:16S rRNA (guanine(527)-N(7))-methyltransferase RsmG [Paracoccaceae bacterium]